MKLHSSRFILRFLLGTVAVTCLSVAMLSKNVSTSQNETAEQIEISKEDSEKTNEKLNDQVPAIAPKSPENTPEATPPSKTAERLNSNEQDKSNKLKTIAIRPGDTLAKIFLRIGLSSTDLESVLSANPACKKLKSLHPGQTLQILQNDKGQLTNLVLTAAPTNTLTVTRTNGGFTVEHTQPKIEKQIAYSGGEIQNSLFAAGKRAGLDYTLIKQMVNILGWDIDFALDIQPNDTFHVLFEEKYSGGEKIGTGHILAVEFVNRGKTYRAVRYTDKNGQTGYFSPDGHGMHKAFLRTPVKFSHISSRFGIRKHPIHHHIKQHKGIDYAATVGTPVKATADGIVSFAGVKGGYGKAIELKHAQKYTTFYAHLSKFAKNIRPGSTVTQGQVIGYVGQSGLATGPHLHYEFRVAGVHRDPLTVALPKVPVANTARKEFVAQTKHVLNLMDRYKHVYFAKNQSHTFE